MDALVSGGVDVVEGWAADFAGLMGRVGPLFPRRDLRGRASGYVRGLLGRVERKNGWQVAEHLGDPNPFGVQRLLGRASWDADAVRDEVGRYAAEHLLSGGGGRDGDLIVDETGFLKKGDKSVGVQRQYSGTAGRIENSQVGVFLALSGPRGRALVDRELYLPRVWCDDPARRAEAGVPADVAFATKPQLAVRMLGRAFAAGLRPRWVLADEVYGGDTKFRRYLEGRGQPYVVAVRSDQRLWVDWHQRRVDAVADGLPADAWHRLSVGDGSKGPRAYDWAAGRLGGERPHGLCKWVLVRRSLAEPADRAYYLCLAPARRRRARPGRGRRRAVGRRVLLRGGQAGGGAGRVRGPVVGRLVPARDPVHARPGVPGRRPGGVGRRGRPPPPAGRGAKRGAATADLVPVTEPEVRRLMLAVAWPALTDAEHALAWSAWRRHHQAVARWCHYRARGATPRPPPRPRRRRPVKAQL